MAIIKQCKSCEKKGVFLKLYKGLCQKCTDELNLLEKQYYEIKSILNGTLEIDNPIEVIENTNIIINNIDKFQNIYTPIRKEICLEVISLMENISMNEELIEDSEPIYINPEAYEKNSINSPEITLNKIPDEVEETIISNEIQVNISTIENNDSDSNDKDETSNRNFEGVPNFINSNYSDTPNIIEELTNDSTIPLKDINPIMKKKKDSKGLKSPLITDSFNDKKFTIPETIILDEDQLENLTFNEKEVISTPLNQDYITSTLKPFENIRFEKDNIIEEKIDTDKTLNALKKLLDNIETTINSSSNHKKNIDITYNDSKNEKIDILPIPNVKAEAKKSNSFVISPTESVLTDFSQNKTEDFYHVEKKSIEDLTLDSILNLNNNKLSPEEKGYNLEVLKNYSSELYKKEIYKLNDINLKKFIIQKENQLLKLINKPYFELFDFFNYVSFSIVKESNNVYILSAVKICYGKTIDTFYSKYSTENQNNDLESLKDLAFRFTNFIDNMLLVTHNANFTFRTLKESLSKVNGVNINNKFICTRNSYIKLCSKLSIPKPNNINLYVCLRQFLSNEEIEEINESSEIDFVDAIKTFKLYEKLKYLINR